jgi:hypothetical protein
LPNTASHVAYAERAPVGRECADRFGGWCRFAREGHLAERGVEVIAPRIDATVRAARGTLSLHELLLTAFVALTWFVVLGYNFFILIAGTGYLLGITQSLWRH